MTEKMETPTERLEYAKNSVRWLLDHPEGSVDFHGIAYWADRVEQLRREIRASL